MDETQSDNPQSDPAHFSEERFRDLSDRIFNYKRQHDEIHESIDKQLTKYNSQSAVLRVLGILVLTVIGLAVGLVIRAEGIADNLRNQIADVQREEQSNTRESSAVVSALRRDTDESREDIKQLRRLHRRQSEKD